MAQGPKDAELDARGKRDPLTGALTRMELEERVARGFAEAFQHGEALALLVADLDHFRTFDAQYGPGAADAALVTIHHRIANALAATDIVARSGYDEFAVFCRKPMSSSYGPSLAQRLRARIGSEPVEIPDAGDAYFFTVSIG